MTVLTEMSQYTGSGSAVALGMFDGVHIGHQALIRAAAEHARAMGLDCVVCTFDINPLELLAPERAPKRILSPDENLDKFEQLGADYALVTHFTRAYAAQPPEDFLRDLVRGLRARVIVTGVNYTFGARGSGNAALLRSLQERYGYTADIIPPVMDEEGMVSSTRIRRMLAAGDSARAEALLRIRENG